MTDLGQYTARALAIAEAYDRLNLAQRGRTSTTEELALRFVGDVGDLAKLVMASAEPYDLLILAQCGRTWTTEELALGFVGDVGDLAKLVMASAGTRDIPNHRELLGHELADCLWAVLVIAARTGVDLAAEFDACMQMLNGIIARKLAELED